MTKRTGCTARQYSDQMQCHECALQWDINDPDRPECLTQTEKQMVDIAKDLEVPVHTLIGKKVGQRP